MLIAIQFVGTALVIVVAGVQLARYGDLLGERTSLGRTWIGVVLLAATTSLPELFTGFGSTAIRTLPEIAVGDVFGSCMFNLLILSAMDAIHPEPIGARAHQGHTLSIGFGLLLIGIAGFGLVAGHRMPALGWVGLPSAALIAGYAFAMRLLFVYERQRLAREAPDAGGDRRPADPPLGTVVARYCGAALVVVGAALWLPRLGAELARQSGLGEAFVGSLFVAITTSLPEIVVSLAAVRMGAVDLGIGNVLGSNLFNLLILGLDDVWFRSGALLATVGPAHRVSILATVTMNALFLIGLTYRTLTKRFVVTWDTGLMALVYGAAIWLTYVVQS